MNLDKPLTVQFAHPRRSDTFPAEIDPRCTAAVAVQQLQAPETGPYLEPTSAGAPWVLVHEGVQLAPETALGDVVADGAVIDVQKMGQGA